MLNFLALSFGKTSIPFGPLIAVLGVGGSLFYLFNRLFIVRSQNGNGSLKTAHLMSFLFSSIVIVTTSLMAPFLYESIDWSLHSLIVTGGLFLANFFIGLVLYFTSDSPKRFGQIGISLVFALVSFCAMGFSEPAALFLLSIYSLIIIILAVNKKITKYLGLIIGFAIGAGCGFLMVALSPGSANRVGLIGVSLLPNEVFYHFLEVVRMSFRTIFLDHLGIGMVAFFTALLLGYTLGRTLKVSLRFEEYFPSTPLGQFVLWLMPFLLTIFIMLPSALLKSYLPLRTLYIPIYFLVVQYFIISVYYGRRDAENTEVTRLLLVIS